MTAEIDCSSPEAIAALQAAESSNGFSIEQLATDCSRTVPEVSPRGSSPGYGYPGNDSERARRFAEVNLGTLRYVHTWKCWLSWDGSRWSKDRNGTVVRYAQELVKELRLEAAEINDFETSRKATMMALRAGDASRINSLIDLARSQTGIATTEDVFDRDPLLLGVANGVVDLRTGTLNPAKPEDFITKQSAIVFDPSAQCPRWQAFLHRVLKGDEKMITFMQRAVGYSLTGLISEQCLFFLYGTGRNGKSTFTETLQQLMGEYGQRAPAALFTVDRRGSNPETAIARLLGTRFVVGSEIEQGSRLAESLVKDLTGGDTLVGRHLYSAAFEFKPTHKLWIFGNHKPDIIGSDTGIWRRIKMIPFDVEIPVKEVDPKLPTILLGELPGILNWAIKGCLEWQKAGLRTPECVNQAVDEYRDEEDTLADFMDKHCETAEGVRVERGELFDAYKSWAFLAGIKRPMTTKQFAKQIRARQFNEAKSGNDRYWVGIGLRDSAGADVPAAGGIVVSFQNRGQQRAAESPNSLNPSHEEVA